MRGAEVFTTAGTQEKADLARKAGADHVIEYSHEDFGDAIVKIAGERPLDVVYDGVGKSTFDRGLTLLKPRGMMVTFGNASGPVDPVSPLRLMQEGSIYLTRPTMFHYIATREELLARTDDLFDWIAAGKLEVLIGDRLPLADAAEAHRRLESRQTTRQDAAGSVAADPGGRRRWLPRKREAARLVDDAHDLEGVVERPGRALGDPDVETAVDFVDLESIAGTGEGRVYVLDHGAVAIHAETRWMVERFRDFDPSA